MFSPSELEGEVDHAFFDSDCEDVRGEKGKKADSNLAATNISSTSNKMSPKPADDIKRVSENGTIKNSVNDNCDNEEEINFTKSNKPFMALLAVAKANENESDEDVRYSGSEIKNEQENNKRITHTLRPPSVSSESNCDTKDPSKASSSGFSGGTDSETSENVHSVSSDECDDTVTDVSPLSSSTSSRLQSLDLNHSETEEDKSVPSSGCSSAQHHECFSQEEDNYSLNSMRRFEGKLDMAFPGSRHRKNYSFTNSEVQRIDRDNQRLLRQLSRFSTGSRPGSVQRQIHSVTSSTPVNRFPHSAINRQREQQRIERDNLAFLKRLESVKPTPGMKRSEQLADYQRQVGYLGMCPVYPTTGKKFLGNGCIQNKAPSHSARATSTEQLPSSTPAARPRKTKAAQPAWC